MTTFSQGRVFEDSKNGWRVDVPARATLEQAVSEVQRAVKNRMPMYLATLRDLKGIPLHGVRDEVLLTLSSSKTLFEQFLTMPEAQSTGAAQSSMTPNARQLFERSLWKLAAHAFDQGEFRLLSVQRAELGRGIEDYLDESGDAGVRELARTLGAVRFLLLAAAVDALPYQTVWDDVDGDAGYLISELSADLARWLAAFHSRHRILDLLGPGGRWHNHALAGAAWAIVGRLDAVPTAVQRWKDSYHRDGWTVASLGRKVPFPFTMLEPTALVESEIKYGRRALGGIMNAVEDHWLDVQRHLPPIASQYRFAINAGSLSHGGHHEPHGGHRDGAIVDLDLQPAFPVFVQAAGGGDYAPPGTTQLANDLFVTAVAFSACILLSFPRQVLFASEAAMQGAKERIAAGFAEAIRQEAAHPTAQGRLARLREMRDRIGSVNAKWGATSAQVSSRQIHANHWHVEYHPSSLGAEPNVALDAPAEFEQYQSFQREMTLPGLWPILRQAIVRPLAP